MFANSLTSAITLAVFLSYTACSPDVRTREHLPTMAAEEAEKFARVTLIDRDFPKAYEMFADDGKRSMTLQQFTEAARTSHPLAFPLSVNVVEYEPVPGQSGMAVPSKLTRAVLTGYFGKYLVDPP
jgi:hypothetical protein